MSFIPSFFSQHKRLAKICILSYKLPMKQGFLFVIFLCSHKGLFFRFNEKRKCLLFKRVDDTCKHLRFPIWQQVIVIYSETFVRGHTPDSIPQEIIISPFISYDKQNRQKRKKKKYTEGQTLQSETVDNFHFWKKLM